MKRCAAILWLLAPMALAQPPAGVAQNSSRPGSPFLGADARPGISGDTLIARQRSDGVLEGFRRVFVADGAPRIAIRVTPRATVSAATAASVEEVQLMRDLERFFARAFRQAGAMLADTEETAARLSAQSGASLPNDAAAAQRAKVAEKADIVIDVRVLSPRVIVRGPTNDVVHPAPDFQATAIQVKGLLVVGRATASDVVGKSPRALQVGAFDVGSVANLTALALMADMLARRE